MADEFLQQRHADENKHVRTTFLAGAPAAIAFALHETADREVSWSLLPILLAVIAWGASFACGIQASNHLQLVIKANLGINVAERAQRQDWLEEANSAFRERVDRTWRYQQLQMWLLFAGASLYLVGHVWTIAAPAPQGNKESVASEASLTPPAQPRPQIREETAHIPPSR